MEDEYSPEVDATGLVKPLSAFHYFLKLNSSKIRDELIREGKETQKGAGMTAASVKWKSLNGDERERYEKLAEDDKTRYEEQCRIRDAEVLQQQEERRRANALVETDTRMRHSTLANTDAATVKESTKRTREVSEKEKEKHAQKKQARRAEEDAINDQMEKLKHEKAAHAEARLKYLLSQSDIFSHFAKGGSSLANEKRVMDNKKSRRDDKEPEELDEDEKAMAHEIGDDEDDIGEVEQHNTVLLKQPSIITHGKLREYQLEGLNWMIRLHENGINGILADEMGLGKTLQSITILAWFKEYRKVPGPHLVMVPKSTLSNWCNEFTRWCPSIRILRFHGNKDERAEIVEKHLRPARVGEPCEWDVMITTYEIVNLEKGPLTKVAWKYLIIDEAHRLKNEESQFSQTVRLLQTEHRLLLTGTPLQNNLHELWALLNFLLPDVFSSSDQFDDWFNLDIDDNETKQRMITQLHKLLRPFMLRRLKVDVEKSLPPKTETILFTSMSAVQKNLYKQILSRNIEMINSGGGGGGNNAQSRTAILNLVMQLRKCCNHPYLFPNIEDRTLDPLGDHLYTSCGKMLLLDKLLVKMKERGHRVLLFTQMTRMLDILEDYMISKGYLYCRIDGNTTYEEREDRIYDYNREGSDRFCFLLSTRAGGLGINLQTADTVILFDSDWNPQADLQAQDRAHRIGQKKPVQVFRLVTDDSVEVKVVERAQQKLKLDAMVVQQGRLQDKEKKMSKTELLETLRFGADKIFRNKENATITDEDIDLILEQGRKRTMEMNEKLQVAEKGDMLDFRLDGGMKANFQEFEGEDYSKVRKNADPNANNDFFFLDLGKRDRKAVQTYAETAFRQAQAEDNDKRPKLPRHLKLNKMEDWQFFNKTRLNELQAEEVRLFEEMCDRGEAPQSGNIAKLVVLPPDLHEEKSRLLTEGFGDWTKNHFNNFVRASAKHGRAEYEKIAKDMSRPVDEIRKYCAIFWERGRTELPPQEWERVTKQIEKGEKRLEEISRLTAATAKLIGMFEDPWEELTFRNVGNVNRIFTSVEDRFLLCLTHLHGYGNWEEIRNSIRRCERFRFDFYLQSCSTETIGKRCELLMKSAERELIEIERKKQLLEAQQSAAANAPPKQNPSEAAKQKINELSKLIADEAKKLAAVRTQMEKVKKAGKEEPKAEKEAAAEPSSSSKSPAVDKEKKITSGPGRQVAHPVPEELYPELCAMLVEAGADGITKVIDKFLEGYPEIPKRQVELKINELAVKEKRDGDIRIVWHIKPEFEKYLSMEAAPKSASKRPREEEDPSREPRKFKRAFGFFVKDKRSDAQERLQAQYPDGSIPSEELKDLLTKMWTEVDQETRRFYEKKELDDKKRYEEELTEYNSRKKGTTPSEKKKKVESEE